MWTGSCHCSSTLPQTLFLHNTSYWIGQNIRSVSKQKQKTHFSLSPIPLLNNILTLLFHYILPSFRQLHNSIFPKHFYLFEQRTIPGTFSQSSRELKFFPLRNFCKGENKWKSKGAMSGEYGGWFRTFHQCLLIKKRKVLHYPDGILCVLC